MIKGYRVKVTMSNGTKIFAFPGFIKTKEDAKKYAAWAGSDAEIFERERKKITTFWRFDETSLCGLRPL